MSFSQSCSLKSFAPAVLTLVAAVLGTSCGSPPPQPRTNSQWYPGCPSGAMGCVAKQRGIPDKANGQDNFSVSCRLAVGATTETRALSLDISGIDAIDGTQYGIKMDNLTFNAETRFLVGGGCSIVVTEGGNTYRGQCGANQPNAGQACQITELMLVKESAERPETLSFKLLCTGLPLQADMTRTRNIYNASGMTTTPAFISLAYCAGLAP